MKYPLFDCGNFRIYFDPESSIGAWLQIDRKTGEITYADELEHIICDIDEDLIPITPPVLAGTSIICVSNGKFLAGVRGKDCGHGKGFLSFPGGKLDYKTDEDTAKAGEREFFEEVGRRCIVKPQDKFGMHPEAFTTNCFFEKDEVHYVTFYMKAEPCWEVDIEEVIPAMEPDKCEVWRWWSLKNAIGFLLNEPDWYEKTGTKNHTVVDAINSIDKEKTQWIPVYHLFVHRRILKLSF